MGHSGKKSLHCELNLIPFLDMLAVCIYFLLLTAIWVQIGSMNVKQAVGPKTESNSKKQASLWVKLQNDGALVLEVKSAAVSKDLSKINLKPIDQGIDTKGLEAYLKKLKAQLPEMEMAILSPAAKAEYNHLIMVMDKMRGQGIKDLGVSPL